MGSKVEIVKGNRRSDKPILQKSVHLISRAVRLVTFMFDDKQVHRLTEDSILRCRLKGEAAVLYDHLRLKLALYSHDRTPDDAFGCLIATVVDGQPHITGHDMTSTELVDAGRDPEVLHAAWAILDDAKSWQKLWIDYCDIQAERDMLTMTAIYLPMVAGVLSLTLTHNIWLVAAAVSFCCLIPCIALFNYPKPVNDHQRQRETAARVVDEIREELGALHTNPAALERSRLNDADDPNIQDFYQKLGHWGDHQDGMTPAQATAAATELEKLWQQIRREEITDVDSD